jgi:hypothetical protein
MIWNLLGIGLKTASEIYKNKKEAQRLESVAKLQHYEKMAKGEIEYQGKIIESHKGDYKDDFVLIVLSSPILLLAYSVFTDDPDIANKLEIFFDKLEKMPWWIVGLWASVVAAIYGLKATDIINTRKK